MIYELQTASLLSRLYDHQQNHARLRALWASYLALLQCAEDFPDCCKPIEAECCAEDSVTFKLFEKTGYVAFAHDLYRGRLEYGLLIEQADGPAVRQSHVAYQFDSDGQADGKFITNASSATHLHATAISTLLDAAFPDFSNT